MEMTDDMFEVDKTAFSVVSLHDEPDEVLYWRSETPQERLRAMELMRQVIFMATPLIPGDSKGFSRLPNSTPSDKSPG